MNPDFYLMLLSYLLFVVFFLIVLWEELKIPDFVLMVVMSVIITIMIYSDQSQFEHSLAVTFLKLAILADIAAIGKRIYLAIQKAKNLKKGEK